MDRISELYNDRTKTYNEYSAELNKVEQRLKAYSNGMVSIIVKTINGKKYYYKQWRDGKKVRTDLLGKVSPSVAADEELAILDRKELLSRREELRRLLNILEYERKELRDMLIKPVNESEYSFEVFWKNELSARVSVRKDRVHISRYIIHPVHQIFHADTITRYQLTEILRSRCIDEGRSDVGRVLKAMGVNEYNPLEIVRRTHGVSYNDYIWIRFPGEKLRAEDVMVRDLM